MPNQVTYGFHDLQSRWDDRVTEVGVNVVEDAIQKTLDEHNRQMDALMGLFVQDVSNAKIRRHVEATTRNQLLDEYGRARPVKTGGYVDLGYPIFESGNAWGATARDRLSHTVREVNSTLSTLITGDVRWTRDQLLAAMLNNVNYTFSDEQIGDVTVKGLANGDTDEYPILPGSDSGATDTHYLAQASAIDDSNDPFETDYEDLMEHSENTGEVICLVPTSLRATVKALAAFEKPRDDNMEYGNGVSYYVGYPNVTVPGEYFGYHESGVHLVHWRMQPAGYLTYLVTEGDRPLGRRQDPLPELRGFAPVAEREDFPYWERQYRRYIGFGGYKRIGALIRLIGNASYARPSGYDTIPA